MYTKSTIAILVAALFSDPSTQFSCRTRERWGFSPVCCTRIEGQLGINCLSAHQLGVTNPRWECNFLVYNTAGCCQPTVNSQVTIFETDRANWIELQIYTNPNNNYTFALCGTQVDPR
ncbi:uncharacterized protein GGS22DRAFT_198566 [Annulohypoxylon maeteangense]|uniref:uncharacterized protein n=1 Tax=Annulohypoxylon maeteangense TaxID=1927788 RepID=UPI002008DF6F|nr:uncharacterized protein GGS22DRAFT_198566 [Annulohypoxylon maeteangense]KAI0887145.1 hypothetical protein GGS22DRAFT_198566 [Annulohypoxylon maeteangense]